MMRNIWLIVLAAALVITLGCKKEEASTTASAVPAMETSVAEPAHEHSMEGAMEEHPAEKADESHEMMQTAAMSGQAVYEKICFACHNTGISGAPKLGDKKTWAPLQAEGVDVLTHVAINGEGAMPPKGGDPELSDEEVRAAVIYMMHQSH
jgi:cytochrome c5